MAKEVIMLMTEEEVLTVKEVAQRLRLSEETVKRLLRKEELPGHKVGGSWRIGKQQFDHYLQEKLGIKPEQER
jgi:excisionase family DNA binding protein